MALNTPADDRSWVAVIACLLPFVLLFVAYALGIVIPFWLYALVLLWCLLMPLWHRHRSTEDHTGSPVPREDMPARSQRVLGALTAAVDPSLFEVTGGEVTRQGIALRGHLLTSPDRLRAHVAQRVGEVLGHVPPIMLHTTAAGDPYVFIPSAAVERALNVEVPSRRPTVNLLLLLATGVTTTIAGAAHQGSTSFRNRAGGPWACRVPSGSCWSWGVHEMGHYVVARLHRVPVSLPYFVPVPFALGTFGAFIRLPPLVKTRRQLFDIGIAGPFAGLTVAIPALVLGLRRSTLLPLEPNTGAAMDHGVSANASILLAIVAKASLGGTVSQGHYLVLHPLAFAGWLGLMITALNLLPVGQLDGGHVANSLVGHARGDALGKSALVAMALLGLFVWQGLLFWALVVFFIAGTTGLPPIDDVTALDLPRRVTAWASFALLAAILLPLPHSLSASVGLHCPYV